MRPTRYVLIVGCGRRATDASAHYEPIFNKGTITTDATNIKLAKSSFKVNKINIKLLLIFNYTEFCE